MKPKLVVLASLLGLFAFGGLGYLWITRGDSPEELGLTAAESDVKGAPAPAGQEPGPDVAARVPEPGSRQLRGRVVRPSACSEEDALMVFALARPSPLDEALQRLEEAREESLEFPLLGPVEVEADGTFTLDLPAGMERAHLLVRGRFLFTENHRSVRVGAEDAPTLTLYPQCGAALRGRVTVAGSSAAGAKSLEGIEVRLSSVQRGIVGRGRTVRTAETASDGSFEFRAIPLPALYELQLRPDHLAGLSLDLDGLEVGQETELELSLGEGTSVAGRVVDEAGVGIAGASVAAVVSAPMGRSDWGEREVQTGADGSFLLEHLPARTLALRADHEGLLQSPVHHVTAREGARETGVVITLERGGTIAGTLLWPDGRPVVAQEVRVEFDGANRFGGITRNLGANRGARGSSHTDDEGHFEVVGLGSGPFCVTAGIDPETTGDPKELDDHGLRWSARLDDVPAGELDLRLVLATHVPVHGKVVDLAGEPVREFRLHAVQLMQTGIGPLARDQRVHDYANEEGSFKLGGLEEGPWNIYAVADDFGASEPFRLDLPAEPAPVIEFRLAPAATVTGIVRNPDGSPVGGAVIRADEGGPEWMADASGAPPRPTATSREDGTFEIGGLTPGTVQLYARAEGFTRGPAVVVEVEPGGRATEVQLFVRAGGILSGEIFGPGGRPVSEAMVQLVSTSNFEIVHTQSDEAGTFRSEHLDPGTWQILVMPTQDRMEELVTGGGDRRSAVLGEIKIELVEIVEGESVHVVFGAPPENPVLITGRLLRAGEPVSDAVVALVREGEGVIQRLRRTSSDREGRFSTTIDGGGSYVVSVTRRLGGVGRQASLEFPVKIPATSEYEIELELPSARVSGVVLGPDRRPAARARVTLMPLGALPSARFESHRTSEDLTGPDGRYDLDGLQPGDYLLAVGGMETAGLFAGSHARAMFGRTLHRVSLSEKEWLENFDIELGLAADVVVLVLDERDRPVADATVFVRDEKGDLLEDIAVAQTDDAGRCKYDGLAAGTYSFSAHRNDLASVWSPPLEVTAGGTSGELTLRLQESTFLWIRLLDGEGLGVQADVRVLDEQGCEVQRMISLDGLTDLLREHGFSTSERRFGPLPPGRYRIEATRAGNTISKRIALTGRKERKQTLRFKN